MALESEVGSWFHPSRLSMEAEDPQGETRARYPFFLFPALKLTRLEGSRRIACLGTIRWLGPRVKLPSQREYLRLRSEGFHPAEGDSCAEVNAHNSISRRLI